MVRQYPYSLWMLAASEGVQDENGDFIPASTQWIEVSPCRDETASGGSTGGEIISLPDGNAYRYKATVFLPLSCPEVPYNVRIQVRDGGIVRIDEQVQSFSRGQLNCRLWV